MNECLNLNRQWFKVLTYRMDPPVYFVLFLSVGYVHILSLSAVYLRICFLIAFILLDLRITQRKVATSFHFEFLLCSQPHVPEPDFEFSGLDKYSNQFLHPTRRYIPQTSLNDFCYLMRYFPFLLQEIPRDLCPHQYLS